MFESTIISGQIYLGKQGEHCARRLSFNDVRIWSEIFGEGTCELIHQRNGDEAPYPIAMEVDNGVPYWYVSSADTAIAGEGKCEIRYIVNGTVVKSNIYNTFVQESLGEGTEAPEPQDTWVDIVVQAGAEAKQSAMSAEVAKSASEEYAEQSKGYSEEAENHSQNAQSSANDAQRNREISSQYAEEAKTHADNVAKKEEVIKDYAENVSANTQIVVDKAEEVNKDATIVKDSINGMNATFANVLKGTVSGINAVRIDDISPIQHNIDVNVPGGFKLYGKNIFSNGWRTKGDWGLSAKNRPVFYFDIPPVETAIVHILLNDYGKSVAGSLRLYEATDGVNFVEKTKLWNNTDVNKVTVTPQVGYRYMLWTSNNSTLGDAIDGVANIQIELGDEATEHEEYKTPSTDVLSVYPTTTIIADVPGTTIEATYNRDINKAFAELQNALLSTGGNI